MLILWLAENLIKMLLLPKKIFLISIITIFSLNFCYHNCHAITPLSNKIIEQGGNGLQILLPSTAFMYSYLIKDKVGEEQLIKSFFLNLTVTYALKISINKKRPNGGFGSFPSAHTSTSFQAAAFVQKRYGWKCGFFAYLGAIFVGFSRIYAEKHYIEDVAAGALLGVMSSYLFTSKYLVTEKNKYCIHFTLEFKKNMFETNFSLAIN